MDCNGKNNSVQHGEMLHYNVIGAEDNENNKTVAYVKGHEKHEWLADILDIDDLTIEILDADYEYTFFT